MESTDTLAASPLYEDVMAALALAQCLERILVTGGRGLSDLDQSVDAMALGPTARWTAHRDVRRAGQA